MLAALWAQIDCYFRVYVGETLSEWLNNIHTYKGILIIIISTPLLFFVCGCCGKEYYPASLECYLMLQLKSIHHTPAFPPLVKYPHVCVECVGNGSGIFPTPVPPFTCHPFAFVGLSLRRRPRSLVLVTCPTGKALTVSFIVP